MRAEDKDVDGRELERDTGRQRDSELEKSDDAELPELLHDAKQTNENSGELIGIVRSIFNHEHVVVDSLGLPARELKALEALQAAVEGRDAKLSQFVYASDRRELLEQALAVLQPNFVSGDEKHAQLLGAYGDVIERVASLREGLVDKEDAQDDLLRANVAVTPTKAEGDQDDDAKPDQSTLTGPERKEPPKPDSSLSGPELKEPPKPATTLTGPEVKPEPKAPSTLGDAKDLEEAQKKPWWKRVLG